MQVHGCIKLANHAYLAKLQQCFQFSKVIAIFFRNRTPFKYQDLAFEPESCLPLRVTHDLKVVVWGIQFPSCVESERRHNCPMLRSLLPSILHLRPK